MTAGPVPEQAFPELMDVAETCRFLGGISRPSLYRGIGTIYPRPIKIGLRAVRWLRSECEAALQKRIAERDAAEGRAA